MPKLIKKATIGLVGFVVPALVDAIVDRPKGTNPTLARIGVVAAGVVAWEFAEALLERKLGFGPKS